MAGAIRMVSLSRGHDPRDFALFAFGGAGPLHAAALARELGMPEVLVPARPGITNALGCVVADLRHDFVNTINQPLAALDMAAVHAHPAQPRRRGRHADRREQVAVRGDPRDAFGADMQFVGQTHMLPRAAAATAAVARASCSSRSRRPISRASASSCPRSAPVLVNLNTSVIGRAPGDRPGAADRPGRAHASLDAACARPAPVWFDGGWHDTPVYGASSCRSDATFAGPAIVEQMDATTVIEPGNRVEVRTRDGNLIVAVGG